MGWVGAIVEGGEKVESMSGGGGQLAGEVGQGEVGRLIVLYLVSVEMEIEIEILCL